MYLPDLGSDPAPQASDALTDLGARLRGLTELLLQDCPQGEAVELDYSPDLLADQGPHQLLLLDQGEVSLERQGESVLVYQPGDLLGLSHALSLPEGKLVAHAARLLPIARDDLIQHVNSRAELQQHWAHYLVGQLTFFREAMVRERRIAVRPNTGFLSFSKGQEIIKQGDAADCVYTLLEGSAVAMRDGVEVGSIGPDEIFGALAVFTRAPRTASVLATSHCSVMVVRKEDFIDLVAQKPQLCLNLIEAMAEQVNQLNQRLAALENR